MFQADSGKPNCSHLQRLCFVFTLHVHCTHKIVQFYHRIKKLPQNEISDLNVKFLQEKIIVERREVAHWIRLEKPFHIRLQKIFHFLFLTTLRRTFSCIHVIPL